MPQRVLHHIKLIGIDHDGLSVGICPLEVSGIIGVDMAVEEKFGFILVQ